MLERGGRVNLDETGRVKNRELTESGGVEEVVYHFAVRFRGEAALPVARHHGLERVNPKSGAHVGLVALAAVAAPALTVEDWHHVIPLAHVRHALTHALHDSACHRAQSLVRVIIRAMLFIIIVILIFKHNYRIAC